MFRGFVAPSREFGPNEMAIIARDQEFSRQAKKVNKGLESLPAE